VSAGVCRRPPGLLPPPGAGATVVVGSSGVASATWAVRRALGTMTANTATVVIIFFTQVPSAPSLVTLPSISKRRCDLHHRPIVSGIAPRELIGETRTDHSRFFSIENLFSLTAECGVNGHVLLPTGGQEISSLVAMNTPHGRTWDLPG
jgi:alkanesulfonate monooxygenase SsuD/methylene tetrahydromethanopterin reductase-like flavin-dependent oxidoreductase (luciferase family)